MTPEHGRVGHRPRRGGEILPLRIGRPGLGEMLRVVRGRPIVVVPLLLTFAYLVTFVVTLPKLLATVYGVADADLAPYLTAMWEHAPGGSRMLMGNAPWYSGFLTLRALSWLPDERGIWEVAPWLASALASLGVGWATAKCAGKAAGLLVFAGLVCTGVLLLPLQFSWSIHGLAYVHVLVLGAYAGFLASDRSEGRDSLFWASVLAATAVTAVGVASDKLVIVAGLLPFTVSGVWLMFTVGRSRGSRLGIAVATTVVGSVGGGEIVGAVLRASGLRADTFPISETSLADVPAHLWLFAQSVFALLNAPLHDGPIYPGGVLGYLCDGAVVALVILAVAHAIRTLGNAMNALLTRGPSLGPSQTLLSVHSLYWTVSFLALAGVYVGTTVPVDIESKRYVATAAYAVVVLGVTGGFTLELAHSPTLAVASVSILLFTGVWGLMSSGLETTDPTVPTVQMSNEVNALARHDRVGAVYAGYWDALPLGWLTPHAVPVYPVVGCGTDLCPYVTSTTGLGITGWFVPRQHIRSMLVIDQTLAPADSLPKLAPAYLGPPVDSGQLLGGRLDFYVYAYDIASRLQRG